MTLPRGWELILIVIVVVLLFGAKRMPDAARSVGRSLRIFKAETKGLTEDDAKPESLPSAGEPGAAAPSQPAPPAQEATRPERTEG
jgi:sec-independent protein translocase protein TatA